MRLMPIAVRVAPLALVVALLGGCSAGNQAAPPSSRSDAATTPSPSSSTAASPSINPAIAIDDHVKSACRAAWKAKADTGDVDPNDPNLQVAADAAGASANTGFRLDGRNLAEVLIDYRQAKASGKDQHYVDFIGQAVTRMAVQLATDCKNFDVSLP